MELHFLKICWGDIILLKSGVEYAMIDTGHEEDFPQIQAYLKRLGVERLSFILLSHFHKDHYGALPQIVANFKVEKVYLKQYSALDYKTAGGKIADDAYRQSERERFQSIKQAVEEHSTMIPVEGIGEIPFDGYRLKLYNAQNLLQKIYDDEAYPNYYHRERFSENQNCLAALLKVGDVNVFFGGDVRDEEWHHPLANRTNTQIAQAIGEEIDIYKVPHHGTNRCNTDEALSIYKPKIAVITNGRDFVEHNSTILQDLKRANPHVNVLLTGEGDIVLRISENGSITVGESV